MATDPERMAQAGTAEEEQFQQQLDDDTPKDIDIILNPPSLSHLKDISSLASWTVSTYKPGNGVQALRHASADYFWQSDGPQPHHLNIHFFKRVSITYIRLHLDWKRDESYTPTRIQLWAGTGFHDLQLVTELRPQNPRGWLGVDLSRAGGPPAFADDEEISDEETSDGDESEDPERLERGIIAGKGRHRIGRGPTLRCFLVQARVLENSQNGKDTHLRGLQLFARDDLKRVRKKGVDDAPLHQDVANARQPKKSSARRFRAARSEHTDKLADVDGDYPADEEAERRRLAALLSRVVEDGREPTWAARHSEWTDEPVLR